MKAHAVPQDIMTVEFKLFGNFLSLREFVFVAVGIAVAYFFYFLMKNGILPSILAFPAILVFGLGGIMMGLVPIQDKSLDKWIMNYLLAIRRPTQRVWKKPGYNPQQTLSGPVRTKDHLVPHPNQQRTTIFTAGAATAPKQADRATVSAEKDESADLIQIQKTLDHIEQGTSAPAPATATPAAPMAQTVKNQVTSQNPGPQQPQVSAQQQSVPKPQPRTTPNDAPTPSSTQTNIGPQPQMPKKKSTMIRPDTFKPKQPPPQPVPPQQKSNVQPPATEKLIEIDDKNVQEYATTITSLDPQKNTVNLVVKDTNGLILPGVVCVIKNAHGDPVRAAISNVLGQVTNNVPLKEGTYRINLSKQGYVFPEISRTLTGKEYPPIEIKSL